MSIDRWIAIYYVSLNEQFVVQKTLQRLLLNLPPPIVYLSSLVPFFR